MSYPFLMRLLATDPQAAHALLTGPGSPVSPSLADPAQPDASGTASGTPEAPTYEAPPAAVVPRPGFLDRAAQGLVGTPAFSPPAYGSVGGNIAGGLASGLARGFSGGRLLDMKAREENSAAQAASSKATADRNYANQLETWKARLKKYIDDEGNVKIGPDLINSYSLPSSLNGKSLKPDDLMRYIENARKGARTVEPLDAALIAGAVRSKTITPEAGKAMGAGMTEEDRRSLMMKGVPRSGGGMAGSDPMTPEAIAFVGDYLVRTGQLLPFGMGNATNRGKVFDYVAHHSTAGDVVQNKTSLTSDQAALTQTQRALDGTAAFEQTARANVKVLRPYIQRLADSGSPLLNMPIRQFMTVAQGDPKMAGYRTALQTVSNEYSRLLTSNPNMTGEMSDAARKEGARLLDGSLTVAGLNEALDVLERDATNRLGSYQERVNTIRGRIRSGGTTEVPVTPAAVPVAPPTAAEPRKGGFWDSLVNGGH